MKLAIVLVLAISATAAADPSKQDALALVDRWVKAQNGGDFAAYGALYDAKFVGVKRTSDGGTKTYTLATWKSDRKKMFKVAQKVAAEGTSVVIKDGKASVQLTQRYQAGGYADHGDKVLVLAPGAGGALAIVREEMLYSAPGWNADPKAELDATALASPITVVVRQDASDPSRIGDCGGVSYTLELTDANKKKIATDIGGGVIMIDEAHDTIEADPKADKLFKFGTWCAGGADYYEIVKSGDALVVRYEGVDEVDPDDPSYEKPSFDTRLTVKLPAGAKVK